MNSTSPLNHIHSLLLNYILFSVITLSAICAIFRFIEIPSSMLDHSSRIFMDDLLENITINDNTNLFTPEYLLHANVISTNSYTFLKSNPECYVPFTFADNKSNILFKVQTVSGRRTLRVADVINTNNKRDSAYKFAKINPTYRTVLSGYFKLLTRLYLMFPLFFVLCLINRKNETLGNTSIGIKTAAYVLALISVLSVGIISADLFSYFENDIFLTFIIAGIFVFIAMWALIMRKEKTTAVSFYLSRLRICRINIQLESTEL